MDEPAPGDEPTRSETTDTSAPWPGSAFDRRFGARLHRLMLPLFLACLCLVGASALYLAVADDDRPDGDGPSSGANDSDTAGRRGEFRRPSDDVARQQARIVAADLDPVVVAVDALDSVRELPSGSTIVAHARVAEVAARVEPSTDAEVVSTFANPRLNGGPLVFEATGPAIDGWIEVNLPIRPNGTTGWVPLEAVELTVNPYRIEIDATAHRLVVYRNDETRLETTVAIGTGDTPTPIGEFFITELLRPPDPTGLYGPFVYGLSAHSDRVTSFNGGTGVIGIHGTDEPELLGQDVSRGCIRVDNEQILEMADFLPLGTPVKITRDG